MQNHCRCVFGLNGVTGMLIATVLLLSILGVLTWLGISEQQTAMQKPYRLENAASVQSKTNMSTEAAVMVVKE